MTFSGTGHNRIYSSNAASVIRSFTIVADFITVAVGRPANTTVIVGQYGLSAATQSWRLEIKVDGYSRLTINDGEWHLIHGNTFSPRWPDGSSSETHVKWEYDYDGGGTGDLTFKDYGWNRVANAWGLIGSRTRTGKSFDPQHVATSSVPIHIGSNNYGANKFLGTIKRLRCYDGVGEKGSMLWDANANDYSGSGTTWVSTTSGETWHIDGATVDVD